MLRILRLCAAVVFTWACPVHAQGATVILNVSVVPMDIDTVLTDHAILVDGDQIAAVTPTDLMEVPPGASRIDGDGRFVMPGLADMHVHLYGDIDELALYIANGVTTVRDLSGQPSYFLWRDAIVDGRQVGPTLYLASPLIDAPRGRRVVFLRILALLAGVALAALAASFVRHRPTSLMTATIVGLLVGTVGTFGIVQLVPFPDVVMGHGAKTHHYVWTTRETRQVVRAAATRYDAVKLYEHLSARQFRAALDEARLRAIRAVVHVPLGMDLPSVLEVGADELAHTYFLVEYLLATPDTWRGPTFLRTRLDSIARAVRDAGVTVTTTLMPLIDLQSQLDDPASYLTRAHVPYLTSAARAAFELRRRTGEEPSLTYSLSPHIEWGTPSVVSLARLGARVVLGTDASPQSTVVAGFAVHDELDVLIAGGLTPFEALQLSTLKANRAVSKSGDWGRIAPGQRADLVMTTADPRQDHRVLRHPEGVMARGRWFDRAALDSLLRNVAAHRTPLK